MSSLNSGLNLDLCSMEAILLRFYVALLGLLRYRNRCLVSGFMYFTYDFRNKVENRKK